MRVILCDDDEPLRRVLNDLLAEQGHEIVGEADDTEGAIALLGWVKPDAIVVDLALRLGSGRPVANAAIGIGCGVVVFSAFVADLAAMPREAVVVDKPDFAGLVSALSGIESRHARAHAASQRGVERRRTVAGTRQLPMTPIEELNDFYRALGDACTGDALVRIRVPDHDDAADDLAVVTRAVLRAYDHVTRRNGEVIALLAACGNNADDVADRIQRAWAAHPSRVGDLLGATTVIGASEGASDALSRLRSLPSVMLAERVAAARQAGSVARYADVATASSVREAREALDRVTDDLLSLRSAV